MYSLIIAESELELIPEEIQGLVGKRGGGLLDSSLHHSAMRHLPEAERRGRPDIVHFCLLLALDSLPARQNKLRTFVHTRQDVVMEFSRDVRLPRNYERFKGLMQKALTEGDVEIDGEKLISVRKSALARLVESIGADAVILEYGEESQTGLDLQNEAVTFVIGGFPRGNFRSLSEKNDFKRCSLAPYPVMAWTAVSILLCKLMTED